MTDTTEASVKQSNTVWYLTVGSLIGLIFSLVGGTIQYTGSRMVSSGETTTALTVKVDQLLVLSKEQRDDNKDQQKEIVDLKAQIARLYTRQEAQEDRADAGRRFQILEARVTEVIAGLGDFRRRLEMLESSYRSLQLDSQRQMLRGRSTQ